MSAKRGGRLISLLLFLVGFNGAVGTNLWLPQFYLVPGISWIDALVVLTMVGLVQRGGRGMTTTPTEVTQGLLVVALSLWLMASTLVNAFVYDMQPGDLLPALRLFYFLLLTHVTRALVSTHGAGVLIRGFLAGVLTLAVSELVLSTRTVAGLPLLVNPNVTGALLGLGVWFATLATLFTGGVVVNAFAVLLLSALSITSFSKGAWIMCGCGVTAFFIVLNTRRRPAAAMSRMKRVTAGIAVVAMIAVAGVVVRDNYDLIAATIALKIETTSTSGSATTRADLALAGWYAGLDHPIFGLGYRNFYQTQFLYPELHLPPLERLDNAHNLFAQTLAVGGFPAAALLVFVVLVPMLVLWQKLKSVERSRVARALVWSLSLAVWVVYGSVQLQLIAQPPFWIFCGIVFGLRTLPVKRKAQSPVVAAPAERVMA